MTPKAIVAATALVLAGAALGGGALALTSGGADDATQRQAELRGGGVDERCRVEGPVRRTAARTYVLHVLRPEKIFTRAEAARLRPRKGEVIVRGSLPTQARAGSAAQTHVSVHILARASAQAVWRPYPLRVTLALAGQRQRPVAVAVALMQGVGKGLCDRHYGTNLRLENGRKYELTATLGGETVAFAFRADSGHAGHDD